jgi:serine O-acetyltransferase
MFSTIREDIRTVFAKDPAAKSTLEVVLCYPGLHALWMYRIEIHPGAAIGRRFFIDHGAGVVIGETSEIGDDVLLYQGVVLGGTTSEKKKRHPTLGSNVVMGAGAVALGAITIGDGARIGSGSVVIKSVSPGVTVVGIPGRAVEDHRKPIRDLEHGRLPDPVAEAIRLVLKEQDRLEERMERLEKECGLSIAGDELGEERKKIEEEMEPEEP